jgi:hypothetical protein
MRGYGDLSEDDRTYLSTPRPSEGRYPAPMGRRMKLPNKYYPIDCPIEERSLFTARRTDRVQLYGKYRIQTRVPYCRGEKCIEERN